MAKNYERHGEAPRQSNRQSTQRRKRRTSPGGHGETEEQRASSSPSEVADQPGSSSRSDQHRQSAPGLLERQRGGGPDKGPAKDQER